MGGGALPKDRSAYPAAVVNGSACHAVGAILSWGECHEPVSRIVFNERGLQLQYSHLKKRFLFRIFFNLNSVASRLLPARLPAYTKMFTKTAKYYDAIYSFKDYTAEAASIRSLIRREHAVAKSILDVGCGTGEHARQLAADFAVDGIDLEPEFIAIAQSKASNGTFSVADLRSFSLGRKYDVILCLFSSIGYLLQEAEVVQALTCFKNHLADGGVILVEPWFTPDTWHTGRPSLAPPVDLPELKICRMNVSDRRGDVSLLHFHYLIATPAGVEHVEENHELALYTTDQMRRCFASAGLVTSHDPKGLTGRGLYVARRPDAA